MQNINETILPHIILEAKQAAYDKASLFFFDKLKGMDQGLCGFAWVHIKGIHGNSKLAKALKREGITKDYTGNFCWWNPSGYPCQNIDTLETGAYTAADVLRKYGLDAQAGSRLD